MFGAVSLGIGIQYVTKNLINGHTRDPSANSPSQSAGTATLSSTIAEAHGITVLRKSSSDLLSSLEKLLEPQTYEPISETGEIVLPELAVRAPSIIYIVDGPEDNFSSMGSAIMLNPQGFFLTTHHVIEPATQGQGTAILFDSAALRISPAHIVAYAQASDLAIGKVDSSTAAQVHIANTEPPRSSLVPVYFPNASSLEEFYEKNIRKQQTTLAYRLNATCTVLQEVKLGSPVQQEYILGGRLMELNSPEGSSGSPVFDLHGRLTGLIIEKFQVHLGKQEPHDVTVYAPYTAISDLITRYIKSHQPGANKK